MDNGRTFDWGNFGLEVDTLEDKLAGDLKSSRKRQLAPNFNAIRKSNEDDSSRLSSKSASVANENIIEVNANNISSTIKVNFPFVPYQIQTEFVNKLISCLESGGNALLESPTGTGKTACLLSGSLCWQKQYSESIERSEVHQLSVFDNRKSRKLDTFKERSSSQSHAQSNVSNAAPKILYASRTHSQLSQAIGELKKINFPDVKAVVIGSRDQLCIHPEVKQETNGTIKTHLCRQKVKNRTCTFYNNFEKVREGSKSFTGRDPSQTKNYKMSSRGGGEVLDIEDLVKQGINQSVCPYFYSREMSSNKADIVFMPYNYVIDPNTRKAQNIELTNNVVIFDEGHNIDSLCEETASFSLTSLEVAAAFKETQKLLEKMAESERKFQGKEANEGIDKMNESNEVYLGDEALTPDFNTNEVATLATIFHKLEATLLNVHVKSESEGAVLKGNVIYSWLEDCGLKSDLTFAIISTLDKISSYLSSLQSTNSFNVRPYGILKMTDVLKQLYPDLGQDAYANYFLRNCSRTEFKMHVSILKERDLKYNSSERDPWAVKKNPTATCVVPEVKPRIVNYWCFSPAYAVKNIVQHNVRSLIITSGTLSPLSSFEQEMRLKFPWQLQNPHIVNPSQFFVAVAHCGPLGTKLSSVYSNRNNKSYLDDMGALIANMSKLVPHGLLVFFPSYTVMSGCIEAWKASETWNRITQYKPIYVEPRDKSALLETISQYKLDVKSRENKKGAAFFAVCRGKVSEGLDFADINGRAVIITGLPYPPHFDPRVKLKMEYLDALSSEMKKSTNSNKITSNKNTPGDFITKSGNQSASLDDLSMLDGRTWYQQQALRAVNQAVGRVLRHKNDYGAILLCDERFAYPVNINHLSSWIRPSVRQFKSYQTLPKELTSFYRVAEMRYPYNCSEDGAASTAQVPPPSPPKVVNPISGESQLRVARPGLKKSNQIADHLNRPHQHFSTHSLTSLYEVDVENVKCDKPKQNDSLLTQLLSFGDEEKTPASNTDNNNSEINILDEAHFPKKKKIKLVRSSANCSKQVSNSATTLSGKNSVSQSTNGIKTQSQPNLLSDNKAQNLDKDRQSTTKTEASSNHAEEMLTMAKKLLSVKDAKYFASLIYKYRKESLSVNYDLLSQFIELKLNEKEHAVLRAMIKRYIKPEHRERYIELCFSSNADG